MDNLFIEQIIDNLNSSDRWVNLSRHQKLEEWFITKYIDRLDIDTVLKCQEMSSEFRSFLCLYNL